MRILLLPAIVLVLGMLWVLFFGGSKEDKGGIPKVKEDEKIRRLARLERDIKANGEHLKRIKEDRFVFEKSNNSDAFSKMGIEYNDLAKAFNGIIQIVKEIEDKMTSTRLTNFEFEKVENEVIMVAYLCRINIINRMDRYNWSLTTPIHVPNISSERTTLKIAYDMTVGEVSSLAKDMSISDVVQSVLEKGHHFYKFENGLPVNFKMKLNEGL